MNFPADLPGILYYRVGDTVRVALPRRPVSFLGSSGATDAHDCCPTIPYGADAWQLKPGDPWIPLVPASLPGEWAPFLNRTRPGPMDPRPAMKGSGK